MVLVISLSRYHVVTFPFLLSELKEDFFLVLHCKSLSSSKTGESMQEISQQLLKRFSFSSWSRLSFQQFIKITYQVMAAAGYVQISCPHLSLQISGWWFARGFNSLRGPRKDVYLQFVQLLLTVHIRVMIPSSLPVSLFY